MASVGPANVAAGTVPGPNRPPAPGGSPGALTARPVSLYVYGESRMIANLVAHALARWLDPGFLWVEVVDRGAPGEPGDRRASGWVEPTRRHYLYRGQELPPSPPVSEEAIHGLVTDDEGSPIRSRLAAFVRFPEALQELVARESSQAAPHVLLISNTDFTEEYYPPTAGAFRPFLGAAAEENVTVVCSRRGGRRENRFDFDIVLRVESGPSGASERLRFHVEKGLPGTPFAAEGTIAAEGLAPLAEVLRALEDAPGGR